MAKGWTQPEHMLGAPTYLQISASFRWPAGWRGSLQVRLEGEDQYTDLVKWSELTTEQLQATLKDLLPMVWSLLFNEELVVLDELGPARQL